MMEHTPSTHSICFALARDHRVTLQIPNGEIGARKLLNNIRVMISRAKKKRPAKFKLYSNIAELPIDTEGYAQLELYLVPAARIVTGPEDIAQLFATFDTEEKETKDER